MTKQKYSYKQSVDENNSPFGRSHSNMEPKKNEGSDSESIRHKSTERRHLSQKRSALEEQHPIKSEHLDEVSMRIIDEGRSIAAKEESAHYIELVVNKETYEKLNARQIKISCELTEQDQEIIDGEMSHHDLSVARYEDKK